MTRRTPSDDTPPHTAARCLRACGATDHACAEELRARSSGENGRARKRRAIRMKRKAAVAAADASFLDGESR